MVALTSVPDGELWGSFPEANRNDILVLLGMLLERLAVIYVRQSSRQQVMDHGESTRLQYGLTGRAAALGWPASRVMVIDQDLGRSAANAAERPGFARLVAEITMGHVGLVLGLEMSRLARAGRDWHQLIGAGLASRGAAGRRVVTHDWSGSS